MRNRITKAQYQNIIDVVTKHTGLTPYPEQLKAAKRILEENIVEMKTGEGKSLVVMLATSMLALSGRNAT